MLVNDFQAVLSSDVCIGKEGNIIINKDTTLLDKRKEAFQLKVSDDQLYVTGSDAHGVAYGILEISRLIGVSPWEWWADVMPLKRSSFSLANGYVNLQAPSVEFRGIIINDVDWGLMPWSSLHYEPIVIPQHSLDHTEIVKKLNNTVSTLEVHTANQWLQAQPVNGENEEKENTIM